MREISKHIVILFLLLIPLTLHSISEEHIELNNNLETKVLADASSQKPGLKQGLYKTYYPNGIIKEELIYKDGKLNGIAKRYDESGFLTESLQYKNGIIDGYVRTYNRGKLTSESIYKEGKYVESKEEELDYENIDLFSYEKKPDNKKSDQAEETIDLSTNKFKYLPYFSKLKKRIYAEWKYPKESGYRGENGEVLIKFTLEKNGELIEAKILTSSGYSRLDDEAIRAITTASPFPPFPESWGSLEKLNIRANFVYESKPIF